MGHVEEQQPPLQQIQQERPPEHLLRSWREAGGETDLEVKNAGEAEFMGLVHTHSWSGLSSATSSQSSASNICNAALQQEKLAFRFLNDIFSSSEDSDSTSDSEVRPHLDPSLADAPAYGWSKGARHHASGQCNPCIFISHGHGCTRGEDCNFCHLAHEPAVRRASRRPSTTTRSRLKITMDELREKYKDDPERHHQLMLDLAAKHPHMCGLFLGIVAEQCAAAEASAKEQPACYSTPKLLQHESQSESSQPSTSSRGSREGPDQGRCSSSSKDKQHHMSL
eukprot:TRINITY_DN75983_c0_g1_i1.p1 TRINITY_DN75983_c0_g1~~TRINITY_DN75983_c0_g1_i1.p1  ORF type:complete len:281 (-),score=60.31 TRINITY_DN75983_c0_g1_i1:158-1000(-)